MSHVERRSRLSIDIPLEEKLLLKMWATSQNKSISDLVLSCVREHMPCGVKHVPNAETRKDLEAGKDGKGTVTFDSPLEMFNYLGLPTTCLSKDFQKNLKKTSKKRVNKKKI